MKAITFRPHPYVPRLRVYLMPDADHPEVDPFTSLDDADRIVLVYHPDHDQLVRDAVAIEQERPAWWREMREFQTALERVVQG